MTQARPAAAQPTVVFDFDGTLVRCDSFVDFSRRFCVRRPHRLLAVLLVLPLVAIMNLRSRQAASSILLWAMTVGSPTRRLVIALSEYARDTLPRFANEAIFSELATHQRQKKNVVIATGTVPLLVRHLLRARGIRTNGVVGTRFRSKAGGLVVETYCTGNAKVRELERRLGVTSWQAVYTDSFADRALIRRAHEVTLVEPQPRTLQRTQLLLGPDAPLRVLSRGS